MSRPITAVCAYCAIGPKGLIDLDMVRRSDAAARWAAGNVEGMAWPALERSGWRVVPVRVSVVLPGEEEAPVGGAVTPVSAVQFCTGDTRSAVRVRSEMRPCTGERKPPPGPGADENRMKLLRVGEIG